MTLQRHLLLFSIIFFCLSSTYHLGEASSYNAQASPSYFSSIWNGKFKGFFKQTTQDLTLHRFDDDGDENYPSLPAGPGRPASKTVSVDDFGARGDGSDDTEVLA